MDNKTSKSYIMLISSMLIFGTIGVFRRYIPLSSSLLACSRGFIGSVCIYAYLSLKGHRIFKSIDKRKLLLLSVSGGLMGFNWILLFEAYRYTSVAVATLCYYMAPTMVILLSPIIFKEKLSGRKKLSSLLALTGMVLISGVIDGASNSASDFKGVILGLGAAVLYASVVIINKKITLDDPYEKTVIQLFSAAVILVPYLLLTEDLSDFQISISAVVMLSVLGIIHTGLAYVLYFAGIDGLRTQSVAVLSYIDPVSALILSFLILHESMTALNAAGAVLIIGAALISELGDSES